MDRLFKRSNFAKVNYLDKMWDFIIDPDNIGVEKEWFNSFPQNSRKMIVPSCWNSEIDLFRYTGTAWYKTTFETQSKNIYINFGAVQNEADVYLDGKHLGNHYGGFLQFGYEVNNLQPGVHTLTVRVNNTINLTDTYPLSIVDWYNYGGISRGVYIRELGESWIEDYKISYEFEDGFSNVSLSVNADIKTFSKQNENFEIYVNDEKVYSSELEVDGQEHIFANVKLENIKLWGIHKPELYYIRLVYGKEDIIERIGFREIKTEGQNILLNGEKIKILGVNRHEEHPDWGFSMPFNLIKKDIDIVRNLNCNAIRTSHYPNSQKTADYCDEIGMLFWSEIPAWCRKADAMTSELSITRALSMVKEMIEENFHHPSIIFWGMSNECATDTPEGYAFNEKLIKQAKSMDSSRLITFVSNKIKLHENRETAYGLADVVCLNHYIGWYFPAEDGDWNDFMEGYKEVLKACNSSDKPFLMTEFGFAALLGVNEFESSRWTEDYQADALEFTLNQILNNERISGGYIWQMCDARSIQDDIMRPRCYNNKGILDQYRHPKRAYRTVQRIYGEHLGIELPHYETLLYKYTKNIKMEKKF